MEGERCRRKSEEGASEGLATDEKRLGQQRGRGHGRGSGGDGEGRRRGSCTEDENLEACFLHGPHSLSAVVRGRVEHPNHHPRQAGTDQRSHRSIVSMAVAALHVEVGTPAPCFPAGYPDCLDFARLGSLEKQTSTGNSPKFYGQLDCLLPSRAAAPPLHNSSGALREKPPSFLPDNRTNAWPIAARPGEH